ncbi:hypothetical protein HMPREF3156_02446 [Neisseria sp. HMSC06F02]|nr:hypothetical protein HMPREF3156_02446 [Neisseria sp. HMSC06F02]
MSVHDASFVRRMGTGNLIFALNGRICKTGSSESCMMFSDDL